MRSYSVFLIRRFVLFSALVYVPIAVGSDGSIVGSVEGSVVHKINSWFRIRSHQQTISHLARRFTIQPTSQILECFRILTLPLAAAAFGSFIMNI